MSDLHSFPFSLKRDGPASRFIVNLHSFTLHNRLLCCFVKGGGDFRHKPLTFALSMEVFSVCVQQLHKEVEYSPSVAP